jgi:steroid 5-alpha reductase family enzyme
MIFLVLEALVSIALVLSALMAMAWVVQQRTGSSGWVDTIWTFSWTFSLGLVGAGSALWPVADVAPDPRWWLVAVLVTAWSLRLGITGIPPLEQQMLRSRGGRFRDDQWRTSGFFPLSPRHGVTR